MQSKWRNQTRKSLDPVLYSQNTEATFIGPAPHYPPDEPQSRWQRFLSALGKFFSAVVRKVKQLLAFALIVLLLLLLIRFLLLLFGVSNANINLFTQWTFALTNPLIAPFDHLFAPVLYQGLSIDITTIISIGIYTVSVIIVRQFLKLLVSRPK